ncbi:hypothetical protein GCM10028808_56170 [Spirosoma migulaei]
MDFFGAYDQYLAERHQPFVQAPLLAGWEFRQKPILTPKGQGWIGLAKAQDWKLSALIRYELLSDNWAIVITDINQVIHYVNSQFENMTGYTSQETLGRKPSFLQGVDTQRRIRHRIRQRMDRQKPVRGRILNYRKDQTPYWCQLIIRPIVNRRNQVVNFVAFEREIEK